MASLSREFANALQGVFGPSYATPIYPNSTLASASGEGTLHDSGRGVIYGVSWSVTGNNTGIDFRLVDASATSVGTPVIFNIKCLELGTHSKELAKPIEYDKGLRYVISATGAAQAQMYIHWSPFGNPYV